MVLLLNNLTLALHRYFRSIENAMKLSSYINSLLSSSISSELIVSSILVQSALKITVLRRELLTLFWH
jgi:hypothetical protein